METAAEGKKKKAVVGGNLRKARKKGPPGFEIDGRDRGGKRRGEGEGKERRESEREVIEGAGGIAVVKGGGVENWERRGRREGRANGDGGRREGLRVGGRRERGGRGRGGLPFSQGDCPLRKIKAGAHWGYCSQKSFRLGSNLGGGA